ncbi:TOMM precursor leader peptide-binding protein [Bradyrhizobium sp. ORS 111]|uniref:TOMM precursor leader peptide-binding protein n=1 Tax=Bradyrhizobium sp. ORS 111 TaxID=1685958 RepID=UPI003890516B
MPRKTAQQANKDVLQFAPNFTAYVLPPDVVCLYSEDRKFFLHGELYCALVAAIGKNGCSVAKLADKLGRAFPPDKIDEAIKRLIERRYAIIRPPAVVNAVDGLWASLGLPGAVAGQNLQNCRVRIETIDVKGAAELSQALQHLGVRIVKTSPDLTVTLVNDYLDRRLAERNLERVSGKSAWLLVQPSGVFPLVGPIFKPGETACWTCLFDRMIRNREIKGFLDRGAVPPVAVSPLAQHMVGQSGIQFAAIEIAKAIASGFRTDLHNHIISLDLLGSTIARHYVAARPQCPTCGSKQLQNPRRAARPIELGPGARLVMTSGGYRTVSSRATVARFRKHVSPLTGVVKRLERIDVDLPMNTNFYAQHNFSAPAQSLDELRAGLSGGSFGKGSTAEQGEASALMEAIERYSGIFQGDEIRIRKRFTDFPSGDAIRPNDILLFSDEQYRTRLRPNDHDSHHTQPAPEPFDPSARIEWSPVWSLRDKHFRHVPTSLLYFFYDGPAPFAADSNGCAAGNTREEAIVQGFLELMERDAYAIWWYNRSQRAEVDLNKFDDSYVHDLKTQLEDSGRRLWVLDITSDLGVPAYVAIVHWMQNGQENIEFGSGAHFDPRIALLRSLTELNQFLSIGLMGGGSGEKPSLDGINPLRLEQYPFLLPSPNPIAPPAAASNLPLDNTRAQVDACVNIAARAGMDFLVLDQTRPDVEVPVVRVIVPGMRHFYRRFAPGRLYDVPVKLGLRHRPTPESELTPFLPHT